ncbi:MAG: hypothetical protein Q9M92_10805 [Enterobacterales bacterium]|nr:hypothetical protein [Enterobacterales bacterium]
MNSKTNQRKSFTNEAERAIFHTAALIASIKPLLSVEMLQEKLQGRVYLMANFESQLSDATDLAPSLMTADIKKKRIAAELCRQSVLKTLEKKKAIQLSSSGMSKQQQNKVKNILKGRVKA